MLGGVRVVVEQPSRRHQHAGGAEPALQPVTLDETLLNRVELTVALEAFDGVDRMTVGHDGEHGARFDRYAVEPHDTGATVRGVAAPVRSSQSEMIPQVMDEE